MPRDINSRGQQRVLHPLNVQRFNFEPGGSLSTRLLLACRRVTGRKLPIDRCMPISYTCYMKRTCVFLTPQQIAKLERLAAKTGLKMSELIRRFIDAGLEKA